MATTRTPELKLSVKALAGLFSGMYKARTLANWGQLSADSDAVLKADTIFATTFAPHCPDHY